MKLKETETAVGPCRPGVHVDRGVEGHSLERSGHRDDGHGLQETVKGRPGL